MNYQTPLSTLLEGLSYTTISGSADTMVSAITHDSRASVATGTLFIALSGHTHDGHTFIPAMIEKGVRVILCERELDSYDTACTYVIMPSLKDNLGVIASRFYKFPSRDLKMIGVTGTNGKTTIATCLYQTLQDLGYTCGLISTIENKIGNTIYPTKNTTPDAVTLQSLLASMRDAGCTHCCMEISSHSIALGRIAEIEFHIGIFTNLTHDHLDFHGTLENYAETKQRFFTSLPITAWAITNTDDPYGEFMVEQSQAKIIRYSIQYTTDISYSTQETKFALDNVPYTTPLIGEYNLSNTLAILTTLRCLEISHDDTQKSIAALRAPAGRLQIIKTDKAIGIVDYAHTPDAVERVLSMLRDLKKPGQMIVTIIGCGGDRDPLKRPIMAEIAVRLSDHVLFTSDNPRSEDPKKILDDMTRDLNVYSNYEIEVDRRVAIQKAFSRAASSDDIVVALGKGHENYQEVGGVRTYFSDTEEIIKYGKN